MIEWKCPICGSQRWEPSRSFEDFAKVGFGRNDTTACVKLKCHKKQIHYYVVFNKVECLSCSHPEYCGVYLKQFNCKVLGL